MNLLIELSTFLCLNLIGLFNHLNWYWNIIKSKWYNNNNRKTDDSIAMEQMTEKKNPWINNDVTESE